MRVVDAESLEVVEIDETRVPYAILSHRWEDGQEITLGDLEQPVKDAVTRKNGYHKVKKACEYTLKYSQEPFRRNVRHIWIDTCCIDKTSSAELSEAINSMYRWYRGACVCFAFLSDVSTVDDNTEEQPDLSKSAWFTRGWTLQELLAPLEVIFVTSTWDKIGTMSADAVSWTSPISVMKKEPEQDTDPYKSDLLFEADSDDVIIGDAIGENFVWDPERNTLRRLISDAPFLVCISLHLFDLDTEVALWVGSTGAHSTFTVVTLVPSWESFHLAHRGRRIIHPIGNSGLSFEATSLDISTGVPVDIPFSALQGISKRNCDVLSCEVQKKFYENNKAYHTVCIKYNPSESERLKDLLLYLQYPKLFPAFHRIWRMYKAGGERERKNAAERDRRLDDS